MGFYRPSRHKAPMSPLDRAATWEIKWQQTAPIFEAARAIESPCFVYFIGEEDDGPIKIGTAKDPVLRLRDLQTGNPRRLQIEYVLVGDARLEQLLHVFWGPYMISPDRGRKFADTEWFITNVRHQLEPVVRRAIEAQLKLLNEGETLLKNLGRAVRDVHSEHGCVIPGGKVQVASLFAD
jgi:hypothetical protein